MAIRARGALLGAVALFLFVTGWVRAAAAMSSTHHDLTPDLVHQPFTIDRLIPNSETFTIPEFDRAYGMRARLHRNSPFFEIARHNTALSRDGFLGLFYGHGPPSAATLPGGLSRVTMTTFIISDLDTGNGMGVDFGNEVDRLLRRGQRVLSWSGDLFDDTALKRATKFLYEREWVASGRPGPPGYDARLDNALWRQANRVARDERTFMNYASYRGALETIVPDSRELVVLSASYDAAELSQRITDEVMHPTGADNRVKKWALEILAAENAGARIVMPDGAQVHLNLPDRLTPRRATQAPSPAHGSGGNGTTHTTPRVRRP